MLFKKTARLSSLSLMLLRNKAYYTRGKPAAVQIWPPDIEYTMNPQYPNIESTLYHDRKRREEECWYEAIRAVPTVEEKLIKINSPRYYGYKVVLLEDEKLPYNCLPAIQHYTRTIFENYTHTNAEKTSIVDDSINSKETHQGGERIQNENLILLIKADVLEAIEYLHDFLRHGSKNNELNPEESQRKMCQLLIEQINSIIINTLVDNYPHLRQIELDYNARHEAFWCVGGINLPKNVVNSRKGRSWSKDDTSGQSNRLIQYIGSPYLALRHPYQLVPWKSEQDYTNISLANNIPRYNFDPRSLGFSTCYRHGTNIPGYWPNSTNTFGYISFQSPPSIRFDLKSHGTNDILHAQAIQSSYAWLLALANYNGFNTFNDLTYPMNTQTIITDGRIWSFYAYQLNTLLVHSHYVDSNPRFNFCNGTVGVKLYEEIVDGKCVGFNDEVLQHLLRFYTTVPTISRNPIELQPYLNSEIKRVANYTDVKEREFLENIFKHLNSNRPRHLAIPEIYTWEKIYKIDNKQRQMEARRRFFELDINPWKRSLDQHDKKYVPKALRSEGPKSKNKFAQTFYP